MEYKKQFFISDDIVKWGGGSMLDLAVEKF